MVTRSSKIRVLIVDDNEETREGTRRLLEIYEDEIEVVDVARDGHEAIEMVRTVDPHVVLMDINMPGMDGLTATQHIYREMPTVQVVIISVQDDPDYMREALRSGASDFISKGYTAEELYRAVLDAYQRWQQENARLDTAQAAAAAVPGVGVQSLARHIERRGTVIAVYGPKGGVGATTVATSLAVGLAHLDREARTILIDADIYYGDVGVFLAMRGRNNVLDVARVVRDEEVDLDYLETLFEAHESGLRVLLAPTNPGDARDISGQDMLEIIGMLRRLYDYVIVDPCSAFNSITLAALDTSDRVLLLSTPDFPSIKSAKILLNVLIQSEYPMERVQLVLNRMDRRYGITAEQVQDHLRIPVVAQIADDPIAARRSVNDGIPLINGDMRRMPAVRGLRELVQFVKQDLQALPDDEGDSAQSRQSSGRSEVFR